MEFSLSNKNVADILHNEDSSQLLTDNMYKWKDEHKTIYVENISSQHSLQYMESLCDDLERVTSSDDINTAISNFVNHIDGICKPLFGKRNVTPGSKSTSTSVLKNHSQMILHVKINVKNIIN